MYPWLAWLDDRNIYKTRGGGKPRLNKMPNK